MSQLSRSFAPLLLLAAAACTPTEIAICDRLDECNALGAGVSASQCAEGFAVTFKNMTDSVRADCQAEMGDALAKESCEGFLNEPLPSCN